VPKLEDLVDAIVRGDAENSASIARKSINPEVNADAVVQALGEAMGIVGRKYEEGEYFIPEMLRSARAANKVMEILEPALNPGENQGTVVIGTVDGDIHDVGKNLLVTFLRASGFRVHDLGVNVSSSRFVQAVKETDADFLMMSALTTATSSAMKDVIAQLKAEGCREGVKVLIGGVSVSEKFSLEIGADGYAKDVKSTMSFLKHF
jgi:5-methyltetrahydrofolate--homocysteine methyltransferase